MKFPLLLLILTSILPIASAQSTKTLAERLGYPPTAKLLVIHADDLAAAHSENEASIKAMQGGLVSSASVMAPCPWFPEIAQYAKANPQHDLGLHLTLTSEWNGYKWGPVASPDRVSSLVDSFGYFYSDCAAFAAHAKLEEVALELRAQVERAKAMGLLPTHFDSHMGCLFFQSPELFGLYLKLGREYRVPVMVGQNFLDQAPEAFQKLVGKQDIVVDRTLTASPEDFQGGMAKYYASVLSGLQPGVTVLVMHTAFDNEEMRGITAGFPGMWDSGWRQADYDFFTSAACRELLQNEGIRLITWREIGELLR